MVRQIDNTKLAAAPQSDDIELVTNYFNDKCNCYSYAVQDYLAGHLSDQEDDDFSYLPRPGQSRGKSYMDLLGLNEEGIRRAIHEDGINFAGLKYPKVIPEGHYVICCFLEPKEYHFLRQNRDGSWSSKDGRGLPSKCDCKGDPMTDPENYYRGDKRFKFVGYFFVPEGGIRVGVRAYETNRLKKLQERTKNPKERYEKAVLQELVNLSDYGDCVVQEMRKLAQNKDSTFSEFSHVWESYLKRFSDVSKRCRCAGYVRKKALTAAYTRPKNGPDKKRDSR